MDIYLFPLHIPPLEFALEGLRITITPSVLLLLITLSPHFFLQSFSRRADRSARIADIE